MCALFVYDRDAKMAVGGVWLKNKDMAVTWVVCGGSHSEFCMFVKLSRSRDDDSSCSVHMLLGPFPCPLLWLMSDFVFAEEI